MKKICFVALGAYPIIKCQKSPYSVGGAELQQVMIAKELAKIGYNIILIDYDHDQDDVENIEKISILKIPIKKYPNGILDYLKDFYDIFKTLQKAGADVYFQRGGIYLITLLFCKMNKKKFFFSVPSDSFVSNEKINSLELSGHLSFIKRICIKFQLKYADVVLVQSEFQKNQLENRLKIKPVIMKNIIELNECTLLKDQPPLILWVSSIKKLKQPELFIELAKNLPELQFLMIGGASEDRDYFHEIENRAHGVANLKFLGFIPYHEINNFFSKSSIFINTSTVEGFPNTFLQAWSCCIPVITLNVDPDEIICRFKLGYHSKEFLEMLRNISFLVQNPSVRERMGNSGRQYIEKEHSIEKNVQILTDILNMIDK